MFTNKLHATQPLGCFTLYRDVNEYIYKNVSMLLATESYRCGPHVTNNTNNQTLQSILFKYFNNGVFIKLYTDNQRAFKGATSLLNILHWNIYRLHYRQYWLSNMRDQILGCDTLAMLQDIRQSSPSSLTLQFKTRRLLPVAIAKSARVWHKRKGSPVYWREVSTI